MYSRPAKQNLDSYSKIDSYKKTTKKSIIMTKSPISTSSHAKTTKKGKRPLSKYLDKIDKVDVLSPPPSATYEKMQKKLKDKELQYSLLLEKYEKQVKKIFEMEETLKQHKAEDIKVRYKV